MTAKKPCIEDGCERPKWSNKHRCEFHHLLTLSTDDQVRAARRREAQNRSHATFVERARVPEREWPAGERWCSGCQGFVPLFYTSGARCRACASRANHRGYVERTYGISYDEYEQLLEFQEGRCYVCHEKPRARRLAIDHDHVSGAVRGLLCANDEFGCNVQLRRVLNDAAAAARLLEYVTRTPLEQMRGGEDAPKYVDPKAKPRRPSWEELLSRPSAMPTSPDSNTLEPCQEAVQERPAAPAWQSDPAWAF